MNYYGTADVNYFYSHGKRFDHADNTVINESPNASFDVISVMMDLIETWEGEWSVIHDENHGEEWSQHTFVATLERPDEKNGPTKIVFTGTYGY